MLLHNTVFALSNNFKAHLLRGFAQRGLWAAFVKLLFHCSCSKTFSFSLFSIRNFISLLFSLFLLFLLLPLHLLPAQTPPILSVSFNPTTRYHQSMHLLHLQMKKSDFTYLSIWHVHCFAPSSSVQETAKGFSLWLVQCENNSALSFKKIAKCWGRCVYVYSTKLRYLLVLIFTLHRYNEIADLVIKVKLRIGMSMVNWAFG